MKKSFITSGPDLDLQPDVHSSMLHCTGTFGTVSYLSRDM